MEEIGIEYIEMTLEEFKQAVEEKRVESFTPGESFMFDVYSDASKDGFTCKWAKFDSFETLFEAYQYYSAFDTSIEMREKLMCQRYKEVMDNVDTLNDDRVTVEFLAKLRYFNDGMGYEEDVLAVLNDYDDEDDDDYSGESEILGNAADDLAFILFDYVVIELIKNNRAVVESCIEQFRHDEDSCSSMHNPDLAELDDNVKCAVLGKETYDPDNDIEFDLEILERVRVKTDEYLKAGTLYN